LTDIAWAAKASLASIRSSCSAGVQPAFSRHRWVEAGDGAGAHDRRIDAGAGEAGDPDGQHRLQAQGPWPLDSLHQRCTMAAPSLMPEALPAVTLPCLVEGRA
jgi:hypothetical protein